MRFKGRFRWTPLLLKEVAQDREQNLGFVVDVPQCLQVFIFASRPGPCLLNTSLKRRKEGYEVRFLRGVPSNGTGL